MPAALDLDLLPYRPDIPAGAITVEVDGDGIWSARVFGVEQARASSGKALHHAMLERFSHWRASYDYREIASLVTTFKILAAKAGIVLAPGSLALLELPEGVLVLTRDGIHLAASEDPLHLFAHALFLLKER